MIYCSKGDSYRVGHVTTDALNLQSAFTKFSALKVIPPSIGYNSKNTADIIIGHILPDQDSSEESPAFADVTL